MKKNSLSTNSRVYAAFLRGINVGGNTVIKMDDLKKLFVAAGFLNVKTILASGNVVFESEETKTNIIAKTIGSRLEKMAGREISVIVKSLDDLRKLEARQPFKSIQLTPQTKAYITFVPEIKKSSNTSKPVIFKECTILEVFDGMVVSVLHKDPKLGTLDLMGVIEQQFGKQVTTRNWNTIGKVLKAGSAG